MVVPLVDNTNSCPQRALNDATWTHITKLTNLVSLFVEDLVTTQWDPPMSFLEMLSNLIQLETLHLHRISRDIYDNMVSPV